jgi:hypothetical protein
MYIFQIIFNSDGLFNNWVFGKPLFKKYQMVFDQDRKTYGFYLELNNNGNNIIDKNIKNNNMDNSSSKISWGIIVILVLISLVMVYIIHKLIKRLPRKLKANELEENFSYDSSNSKYNQITHNEEGKNQLYESV